MPEETVRRSDTKDCECESCKKKAGKPNRVRRGTIHNYTSTPASGWVVRRTADDGPDAATFGVELETAEPEYRYADLPGMPPYPQHPGFAEADAGAMARYYAARAMFDEWAARNVEHQEAQDRKFREQGNMTAEEAVSMAAPRGLWHSKSDSSVTGPEFASHPATLDYWRSQYPALASMFQSLLHGGMRSHDGDTCGLHVNIGTRSFSGEGHLYRFATLVHASPKWATRMSQRTAESTSHWANFTLAKDGDRREWARQVNKYGYCPDYDRYSVLNAQNEGRIEFRLPRGTLRIDRFFAKLEWTASMVEFTRDEDNEPTVAAYLRWVVRGGEYPALTAYLNERFASRLEAAVEV